MKEQLILSETAFLSKSKGYKHYTFCSYYESKCNTIRYCHAESIYGVLCNDINNKEFAFAPTQSLLQKWLREKHKINIEIGMQFKVWFYSINKIPYDSLTDSDLKGKTSFNSFEDALEEGLKEALKLIP